MFAGLRSIIKDDGLWTVFGDTSQNIFGERISWSTLGLDNIRKDTTFIVIIEIQGRLEN